MKVLFHLEKVERGQDDEGQEERVVVEDGESSGLKLGNLKCYIIIKDLITLLVFNHI